MRVLQLHTHTHHIVFTLKYFSFFSLMNSLLSWSKLCGVVFSCCAFLMLPHHLIFRPLKQGTDQIMAPSPTRTPVTAHPSTPVNSPPPITSQSQPPTAQPTQQQSTTTTWQQLAVSICTSLLSTCTPSHILTFPLMRTNCLKWNEMNEWTIVYWIVSVSASPRKWLTKRQLSIRIGTEGIAHGE